MPGVTDGMLQERLALPLTAPDGQGNTQPQDHLGELAMEMSC